jgi:transketolase
LQLGKLIYLYDNNRVTLSAGTDITFTEDCLRRFDAYGWHTLSIDDGNDIVAIERALLQARDESTRPSLIAVRTHIGYGSPHKQDTFEAHGSPLGEEEVRLTKQNLGWPTEPAFHIPMQRSPIFAKRLSAVRKPRPNGTPGSPRTKRPGRSSPKRCKALSMANCRGNWDADIPVFPADVKGMATRVASGK